jgi:hypothetical protein
MRPNRLVFASSASMPRHRHDRGRRRMRPRCAPSPPPPGTLPDQAHAAPALPTRQTAAPQDPETRSPRLIAQNSKTMVVA